MGPVSPEGVSPFVLVQSKWSFSVSWVNPHMSPFSNPQNDWVLAEKKPHNNIYYDIMHSHVEALKADVDKSFRYRWSFWLNKLEVEYS